MLWMSPLTVPITTVPFGAAAVLPWRAGLARSEICLTSSPAIISSGRKYSPASNRFPMISIAAEQLLTICIGSAPRARRSLAAAIASSSIMSLIARISVSLMG